jgi:hypothetical protein
MRARAYVPSLMERHDVAHFRRAVSVWLALPKQLRQARDVDGDTSRLVLRQDLRLPCLGIVVAGVEVRQRLPIGVPDDIAAGYQAGVPGGWEAAAVIRGEEAAGRRMASSSLA